MVSVLSELQLEFGFVCVFTELKGERERRAGSNDRGGKRSSAATLFFQARREEGIFFDQHHQRLWILDLKITLHHHQQ